MLFDTHCHLDAPAFDPDRESVLARARAAGVTRWLIPAVDEASMERAASLCAQHVGEGFMAVGLHPNSTADWSQERLARLAQVAQVAQVVAVGEIGLDYHWDRSPKTTQAEAFCAQLALARELDLPVIIHNREASHDLLPILADYVQTLPPSMAGAAGVLHSFSAPPEFWQAALATGFYIGLSGPLTYKNADSLRQFAAQVPLERLLIETDAPYLTPHPKRGERNEPAYVRLVAERLAALHGLTLETLADITTQNARRLFKRIP
jgi:TatD DNase family protein